MTVRHIPHNILRALLGRKPGECTWCGLKLFGTKAIWCSESCVNAWKFRGQYRAKCEEAAHRQKMICSKCGCDIEAKKRDAIAESRSVAAAVTRFTFEQKKKIWSRYGYRNGLWYNFHEIVPASEGGGLLGPENILLVCMPCFTYAEITG